MALKNHEYPSKLARIAAVLTVLGSIIWIQGPIEFTSVSVGQAILALAALVAWVSVEVADWQNVRDFNENYLNEDAVKLNDLTKIVNARQYYVLKNHNLETYIGSDDYRGLEDLVAYFDQDPFKFHNENIHEKYETFYAKSQEFLHKLWVLYTSDGKGRATWRSSRGDWIEQEAYEKVMDEIADLNRRASDLAEDWEQFLQTAKTDLRGNSIGITGYNLA